ncbi:glycosyltransferase family 2 protein [Bacillus suaedae]|uniref:Glycosyltransferase family 2 protein n=1 Tax=Halalkalibacter suaedae TaxID=2822140 RepID=A0A941APG0_9BACI|nr:glycosyltransferase family 2 protein [Bacillus suaedae]MBP3950068.1 glycosyltransferase family 2 protein [Bacillus suaedae]
MISIIIPTLGLRKDELNRLFTSLADQTSQEFEVIVVSQGNHDTVSELLAHYKFSYKHIELNRKGLSYARNIGLAEVSGTIVTFSDDDCWYDRNAFEKVIAFFNTNTSGLVCYQIFDPEQNLYYKNYSAKSELNVKLRHLFRISSIEIFVNLNVVDKGKIAFDEDFGLGAKYPSGEENIFLNDMRRAGFTISYQPDIVVYHLKPTTESRLNYRTFLSKGPLFRRMFNLPIGFVLLTMLFIKKINHLEKPVKYYLDTIKELFAYK